MTALLAWIPPVASAPNEDAETGTVALFFLPGHLLTAVAALFTSKLKPRARVVPAFPAFVGLLCATINGFVMVDAIGQNIAGFMYAYLGIALGILEIPFWMVGAAAANAFLRKFTTIAPAPPVTPR